VAAIEDRGDAKKLTVGPAATLARLPQAILRERRLSADPTAIDIGGEVPSELIEMVTSIVNGAVDVVSSQFSDLANEERRTGALASRLAEVRNIELAGWELTVYTQGFSTKVKEPEAGADLGIIVDLRRGELQVSKGLWIQAKPTTKSSGDPFALPRLRQQLSDMLDYTDEAYGLVFTPDGVRVFRGVDTANMVTLATVLSETVRCRRGDRRPEFVADTVHKDFLIEMAFTDMTVPLNNETFIL
jgi:hypothetical protein